jgi:hypothetical protein
MGGSVRALIATVRVRFELVTSSCPVLSCLHCSLDTPHVCAPHHFSHTHTHITPDCSKLDEVATAVTEAPIPYDYGPWLQMSPEGLEFVKVGELSINALIVWACIPDRHCLTHAKLARCATNVGWEYKYGCFFSS